MNFFHEWFLKFEQKIFGLSAENVQPTYQHYIPRIQNPDSFSETKGVFNFFDRTNLANFFFEIRSKKLQFLGGSFLAGLAFRRKFHQKNVFLKIVLELFLDLEPKEFRTFANLLSMGGEVLKLQSTCLG